MSEAEHYHTPVLLQPCIEGLKMRPNGVYVDCTLGGGGHFRQIVAGLSGEGVAVGLDRDKSSHTWVESRLPVTDARIVLVRAPFSELKTALAANCIYKVDGVLFDLGVSSRQFDAGDRGFTYRVDSPLDMRMDQSRGVTAAELISISNEAELAAILGRYGDVIGPGKMARFIKAGDKIETSGQFVRVLEKAYGKEISYKVLSKIFQALRIAVNGELEELAFSLNQAVDVLVPGGRLVVMSYHSLEDRIVKNFIRDLAGGCTCPPQNPYCDCHNPMILRRVTKKAIEPDIKEVSNNPRARSAKLRIAEKV